MAVRSNFEPLIGVIDGVNVVFTTPTPYLANTTTLFVRGLIRRIDWADGWFETDPLTGVVTLKEAPLPGDDVQMHWLSQLPAAGNEISPLSGYIAGVNNILGKLQSTQELSGCLNISTPLCGQLDTVQTLSGQISTLQHIYGILED